MAAVGRWVGPFCAAARIAAAAVAVLAAIAGLSVTTDRAIDLDAWSRLCAELVDHPICEPQPVGLEFPPPGAELDQPATRP